MATPKMPGRKAGRPKLNPSDDSDADLVADILARIPSQVRPGWNGSGWSSHVWPAIREELEIKHGVSIPASPTEGDTLPGKRGGTISALGRLNPLQRRIERFEPYYRAFLRDPGSSEGRYFAMAYARRWLRYAKERIADAASVDFDKILYDMKTARYVFDIARHYNDRTFILRFFDYHIDVQNVINKKLDDLGSELSLLSEKVRSQST